MKLEDGVLSLHREPVLSPLREASCKNSPGSVKSTHIWVLTRLACDCLQALRSQPQRSTLGLTHSAGVWGAKELVCAQEPREDFPAGSLGK